MMAVPCDRMRMLSSESALLFWREAYRVAGMMREVAATAMSDAMVDATVSLNLLSVRLTPDAMKQQPRTRRMLERMEPSMLDWTMRISPCLSATMLTCIAC
jgi:hypothetical protein